MRNHLRRYPTPAHTYYVDQTAGVDTQSAQADKPWKTVAKVNAAAFKPGDRVLFKRGETWAEQMIPASSGKPGRYIKYGAYSSGNDPIINGAALNHALYVAESATSPAFLEFRNFKFSGATGASNHVCSVNTHDILAVDCEVTGSNAYTGWGSYGATDGSRIRNIVLQRIISHNNATQGIFIGSNDNPAGGPYSCMIEECVCYSNGVSTSAHHGIYVVGDVTVRNNTCYSNSASGIKCNDETSPAMVFFPKMCDNLCYSNYIGIYNGAHSTLIYNNESRLNTYAAIQFDIASLNVVCVFNTFINNSPTAGAGGGVSFQTASVTTNITFKNNIVVQDIQFKAGRCLDYQVAAKVASENDIDYNIYYYTGSTGGNFTSGDTPYTFANWQALAGSPDANSTLLLTTPGIALRYSDVHAVDTRNLEGLGVAIAGYTRDKDWNLRANPPTPGCYEAVSSDLNPATGSFDFNGTTNRIDWATVSILTASPITISAWIYLDSIPNTGYILGIHELLDAVYGVVMYTTTAGRLTLIRNGTTLMVREATAGITTGRWHHVLVTHDGVITTAASAHCYYNGVEAGSYTTTTNGATEHVPAGSWSLGGRIYDDTRNVDGHICQVAVWNAVKDSATITALAGGAAPSTYSDNLVYYWSGKSNTLVAETGGTGTADGASFVDQVGPVIVYP